MLLSPASPPLAIDDVLVSYLSYLALRASFLGDVAGKKPFAPLFLDGDEEADASLL
jgi:hypothetical protein